MNVVAHGSSCVYLQDSHSKKNVEVRIVFKIILVTVLSSAPQRCRPFWNWISVRRHSSTVASERIVDAAQNACDATERSARSVHGDVHRAESVHVPAANSAAKRTSKLPVTRPKRHRWTALTPCPVRYESTWPSRNRCTGCDCVSVCNKVFVITFLQRSKSVKNRLLCRSLR